MLYVNAVRTPFCMFFPAAVRLLSKLEGNSTMKSPSEIKFTCNKVAKY
jgi:hypothetical protein